MTSPVLPRIQFLSETTGYNPGVQYHYVRSFRLSLSP